MKFSSYLLYYYYLGIYLLVLLYMQLLKLELVIILFFVGELSNVMVSIWYSCDG